MLLKILFNQKIFIVLAEKEETGISIHGQDYLGQYGHNVLHLFNLDFKSVHVIANVINHD